MTALSFAAGYADAAAYLGLGGVFTANMTGNMILLGLSIAQLRPAAAGRVGLSLACFAVGVAIGTLVLRGRRREPRPWHVERAIGLEGLLLVALAAGWTIFGAYPTGVADAVLIGLAALSMGIQSETVRAFGLWGVSTTYMTGTLTSLSAAILARAAPPAPDEAAAPRSRRATLGLIASIWGIYLVAAIVGGAGLLLLGPVSLWLPAIVVVLAALAAARRRLSLPAGSDTSTDALAGTDPGRRPG